MGGAVTEEKESSHAKYLDLVYSQSDTLYELIPHAPYPYNDSSRPTMEYHVNGMVGFVSTQSLPQLARCH